MPVTIGAVREVTPGQECVALVPAVVEHTAVADPVGPFFERAAAGSPVPTH